VSRPSSAGAETGGGSTFCPGTLVALLFDQERTPNSTARLRGVPSVALGRGFGPREITLCGSFSTGRRKVKALDPQQTSTGGRPVATKVSFESGGAFIRETRREVQDYLSDAGNRRSGYVRLYAKAPVAVGLLVTSWVAMVVLGRGNPVILLCLAGITLGAILTAFCIQHDANHGAYFNKRQYNHVLGWTSDAVLGISSYSWRVKHNVAHHTYTNVDGFDDDVTQVPLARFTPSQRPRPWYRFQHFYIWPLYMFMGLRWQTLGDMRALVRGKVGRSLIRPPKGWNLVGIVAGKLIFLGWAIIVPLLIFPWWQVLVAYVSFSMVLSLVMATTFQLAHCVEEASFASADELNATKRVWAVHEVETTVNFCSRNPVLTWLLGGLNYQIEHHLFPNVPHTHYPQIAKIVRRNCLEHGVRYTSQPSLRAALRSHFVHLRRMGRLGLAPEIEMG
jgi:linoleoyl-CoA desaturase